MWITSWRQGVVVVLSMTAHTAINHGCFAQEAKFQAHELHISQKGSFAGRTFKEMKTKEFKYLVEGACVYLGCPQYVPAIVEYAAMMAPQSGPTFYTTGIIDDHAGNEWHYTFPAPPGYVGCDAAIAIGNDGAQIIGKNKGDSFSGNINPRGVSGYASVRAGDDHGHWVFVAFVAKYVPKGTEAANNCKSPGTYVWKCGTGDGFDKGDDCRQLY